MQTGFPPVTGGLPPIVLLSDTYASTHPDGAEVFAVRLHGGARAIPSFKAALARRAGGQPVITASKTEFNAVERSLSVQSTVLRLASLFAGLAALLVVGPLFVRQAVFASADDTSLRALGATRAQLRGVGIGAGIAVGIGAAVTAFVLAVGLSALTPIGIARNIEPHPGVVVNVAYVGVGVFVVFLVSAALAAGAAWLAVGAVRAPSIATRASGVSKLLERARLSPPAGAGARMALVPGGRGAGLPAVATIFGATFSVAMIVGVIVFSASLARLFDHPQQYGWNWDIQIGDSFSPSLEQHAIDLAANPVVAAVAGGTTARVEIGGRLVDALAIKPQRGAVEPVVVAGRAPSAPDEVLLGTRTLHDVHANIGDEVSLGVGDRSERFVVVGRGVLPEFAGAARLGEGATVTFDGMRRVVPDAVPNVVLVRVRPGSGGRALVVDLTKARAGNIYLPAKPSDLSQLGRGGDLSALAAILAAMGVTTLAYALVSSVRRRRRELAILKVLGFSRRQVSATVAWQATVIAGVAIVVGVPLGAVAGQWSWRVFANQLGVVPRGAIPLVALGVVVLGALVLANLTAALPARNAGRTRPTVALHAE
jgi:hypothetical protein